MTIAQTFPTFYTFLPEEFHKIEFHPRDVNFITAQLEHAIRACGEDRESIQRICYDLYMDYNKARPQHDLSYQFGKFCVATVAATVFSHAAMTIPTHEWLVSSLADNYADGIEETYEMGYLERFLNGELDCDPHFVNEILWEWASALFYYARHSNALNPLSEYVLNALIPRLTSHPDPMFLFEVQAWCNIQTWAKAQQFTEWKVSASKRLINIYESPNRPTWIRKVVGIQLSCNDIPELGLNKIDWANKVLSDFDGQLTVLERVHLIANRYRGDVDGIEKDQESIITELLQFSTAFPVDPANIEWNYWLDRMFTIIHNLILDCIIAGKTVVAQKMALAFFGRSPDDGAMVDILHIIPNAPKGICYSINGKVLHQVQNTLEKLPSLIDEANNFLHTTNVIHDYFQYYPQVPEEALIGKPNIAGSEAYHKQLCRYFEFPAIARLHPSTISGYYLHSSNRLPLQPIMIEQLGYTFAQMESFTIPYEARKIRRVLVWRGESMNPEQECTGIRDILAVTGVQVDIVDGEHATVEKFAQLYESDEYDAGVICGHGEFKIYEPHKSYIVLHNQKHINLKEINRLRYDGKKRRLLFLNICDGATTSLQNSPVAIGLSKMLVSPNQSLISHIWPVPSRYAMILNWLFACLLLENDYMQIFTKMIKISKQGNHHIYEFISRYTQDAEILDRIANTSDDYSKFGYWGSLSFMV